MRWPIFRKRSLLPLALGYLLIGCDAQSGERPPEQRCVELGKGCYCAEALDFEGVVPAAQFFDPPDSTSHQCTQAGQRPPWLPVFLRLGGRGVVPGGPEGSPPVARGATVKHVLRENGSGGADHIMNDLNQDGSGGRLDLTSQTLCIRGYVSYSPDHPVPGNIKIARLGNAASGMAWQASWGGLGVTSSADGTGARNPPLVAFIADFQGDGKVDVDCRLASQATAEPLTFDDCRTHWCRYEICADHTPARPPTVRARFRQIGGPASLLLGPDLSSCPAVPTVERLHVEGTLALMDLHGEQLAGSVETGARYLSHGLITRTPYDPAFWPGPALEFEGPDPGSDDQRGAR